MTINQEAGQLAEDHACNYLLRQGLRLLTRNYRCKMGEIDLILLDKTNLVFTEVRYRKPSRFGSATETVTPHKQRKIIKAAMHYLQRYPSNNPCRFDVISIAPDADKTPNITWIRDAFRIE